MTQTESDELTLDEAIERCDWEATNRGMPPFDWPQWHARLALLLRRLSLRLPASEPVAPKVGEWKCECGADVVQCPPHGFMAIAPGLMWGPMNDGHCPRCGRIAPERAAPLVLEPVAVPREPTEAMLDAGYKYVGIDGDTTLSDAWRAMYDAARGSTPEGK